MMRIGYSYVSMHFLNSLAWYGGLSLWPCPCEDLRDWQMILFHTCYLDSYSLRLTVAASYYKALGKQRTQFLYYYIDCTSCTWVHQSDHIFNRNVQMSHTHIQRHIQELPVRLSCLWLLHQQLRHVRCNPPSTACGLARQFDIIHTQNKSQHTFISKSLECTTSWKYLMISFILKMICQIHK